VSDYPYRRTLGDRLLTAIVLVPFSLYALANFAGVAMLASEIETHSLKAYEPAIELLLMGLISSWIAWAIWRL
jgi:hypothetical protein|tara:strand:- start:800 stop:1018 length:219 start_codon:yes stop_codon:yes gene_type:complete